MAVAGKYTVAHYKKIGFAICSTAEELFWEHNIYFIIIIMYIRFRKCIWKEENTVKIAYKYFRKIASTGQFYRHTHRTNLQYNLKNLNSNRKSFNGKKKKRHETMQLLLIIHRFRCCLNIDKMTHSLIVQFKRELKLLAKRHGTFRPLIVQMIVNAFLLTLNSSTEIGLFTC